MTQSPFISKPRLFVLGCHSEVEELRAEVADLQESLEEAEVRRWTGTGGAGDWWLGV